MLRFAVIVALSMCTGCLTLAAGGLIAGGTSDSRNGQKVCRQNIYNVTQCRTFSRYATNEAMSYWVEHGEDLP